MIVFFGNTYLPKNKKMLIKLAALYPLVPVMKIKERLLILLLELFLADETFLIIPGDPGPVCVLQKCEGTHF